MLSFMVVTKAALGPLVGWFIEDRLGGLMLFFRGPHKAALSPLVRLLEKKTD